jgi:hypothetical protein
VTSAEASAPQESTGGAHDRSAASCAPIPGPYGHRHLSVRHPASHKASVQPVDFKYQSRSSDGYEPLPLTLNENPPSRLGSELAEGSPGTLGMEPADGRLGSELAEGSPGTLGMEPADGRLGSELAEGSPGTLGMEPADGRLGSELAEGSPGTLGMEPADGRLGSELAEGSPGTLGMEPADGRLGTLGRLGTPVVQTFTPLLDEPVTDPPPYGVVTFPDPPAVAGIGSAGVAGVPTHCDPVGMEVGIPGSVGSDPAPRSDAALGSDAGIGSDGVATGPTLAPLGNAPATPSAAAVMPAAPAAIAVIRLLRVTCPPLWFSSSMVDEAVARDNDLPG